jgi:hypothetical protein
LRFVKQAGTIVENFNTRNKSPGGPKAIDEWPQMIKPDGFREEAALNRYGIQLFQRIFVTAFRPNGFAFRKCDFDARTGNRYFLIHQRTKVHLDTV